MFDNFTFWAIACMHAPPQPGLKLLAKFSTSKEATPEALQLFAKAKLEELNPDQTTLMTVRVFPVEASRYAVMKPFDGKSYTVENGHLRMWKAPKPPAPPPTTIVVRPPARPREEQNARKLKQTEAKLAAALKANAKLEAQAEPMKQRSAKTKPLIHDLEIWSKNNLTAKQHSTVLLILERIRRIHREQKA